MKIDYRLVMEIGYYNLKYGVFAFVIDDRDNILFPYFCPIGYDGDISKGALEALILETAYIRSLNKINEHFRQNYIGLPSNNSINSKNNNFSNSKRKYVLNKITIISSSVQIINPIKDNQLYYDDLKLRADELLSKFKPKILGQLIDEPNIDKLIQKANKKGWNK